METYQWYESLNKPFFAPPPWLFGVAWSILYPIIFISYGYVFYKVFKKEIPFIVALPFIINLITNLLFSPIQFGTRNFLLASIDVTVIVASLVWAMVTIYPYSKTVTLAQIPYLLWGLFATILQYSITYLNK
jgi:benzodiazapine receptor